MPPIFAFLFPFLIALAGCDLLRSDDPDKPLTPGRRDYVWKVDTLSSPPGGFVSDMWGSSPDNVWAVLDGGFPRLWHFDGSKWSGWPEFFSSSFHSVYGFASNDVWLGGGDGQIHHFDGQEWKLNYKHQIDGMGGPMILDIWGSSPTNIYAAGVVEDGGPPYRGFLLHYNGNKWQELVVTDFDVQFGRVLKGVYIDAIKPVYNGAAPDTIVFYHFGDGRLRELYSQSTDRGKITMHSIGNEPYFLFNQNIHRRISGKFKPILTSLKSSIYGFGGRHEKDIFLFDNVDVFHHDGETTVPFTALRPLPRGVYRALFFEQDVFLVVWDFESGTTLIYNGTLTQD